MSTNDILKRFDDLIDTTDWIKERNQPVALTLAEVLEPASGPNAIIFPPTFAFKDDAVKRRGSHPYPISNLQRSSDGSDAKVLSAEEAERQRIEANVCDLDTVGSQANRMEPLFKRRPFSSLVPQIVIKAELSRVNLLDAGHRVADGAIRFSGPAARKPEGSKEPDDANSSAPVDFGKRAEAAISKLHKRHDATDLAKLAPTSLIFGFWDSRGSKFKAPRILSSTIRATNVSVLRRSAQYNPPFDIEELSRLGNLGADIEAAKAAAEGAGDDKNPLSKQGLPPAPATDSHGGVRVFGSIVRRTEINLVALRSLCAAPVAKSGELNESTTSGVHELSEGRTPDATLKLRRYLLGLALVAATGQAAYDLRQGCLLVRKEGSNVDSRKVLPSGTREDFPWDLGAAFEYAQATAKDFGQWADDPREQEAQFQTEKVVAALRADGKDDAAKESEKKAKATARATGKRPKDPVTSSTSTEAPDIS